MDDDFEDFVEAPEGYSLPFFTWNPQRCSPKLKLSDDNLGAHSLDGSGFKTVLGTEEFIPGDKYYFEVYITKGSLIKIGVSRPNVSITEAFSDSPNGWGIYNGQLRHNSNSTGQTYGESFTKGDTIGVLVDMVKGELSYSKNKKVWGVAFKDEALKSGSLVAACAPIYLNDGFKLKMVMRED